MNYEVKLLLLATSVAVVNIVLCHYDVAPARVSLCVWVAFVGAYWYIRTRLYAIVRVESPDSPFHPNDIRDHFRDYMANVRLPQYQDFGHTLLAHQRRVCERWAFDLLRTVYQTVRDVGGSRSRWAGEEGDNGWKHVCGPVMDAMDLLRDGKSPESPFFNCGKTGGSCPARSQIPAAVLSHSDYYMCRDELSATIRGPTIIINHQCKRNDEYGVWKYRDLDEQHQRLFRQSADEWVRENRKSTDPGMGPQDRRRDAQRERPITDDDRAEYVVRVECHVSRRGGRVRMEPDNGTPYEHCVNLWQNEGCVVGKHGAFIYVRIGTYRDTEVYYAYPYSGTYYSDDPNNLKRTNETQLCYKDVTITKDEHNLILEGEITEVVPQSIVRQIAVAHSDAIRDANYLANLKSSLIQKLTSQKIRISQIESLVYYTARLCDELAVTLVQEASIVSGDPYKWNFIQTVLQTIMFRLIVWLRSGSCVHLLRYLSRLCCPIAQVSTPWCFKNLHIVPYVMDENANRVDVGIVRRPGSCFRFSRSSNDAGVDNGNSNRPSEDNRKLDRINRNSSVEHCPKTPSRAHTLRTDGEKCLQETPHINTDARPGPSFEQRSIGRSSNVDELGSIVCGQGSSSSREVRENGRPAGLDQRTYDRTGTSVEGDGSPDWSGDPDESVVIGSYGECVSRSGAIQPPWIMLQTRGQYYGLVVRDDEFVFKPHHMYARCVRSNGNEYCRLFSTKYRTNMSHKTITGLLVWTARTLYEKEQNEILKRASQAFGANVSSTSSAESDAARTEANAIRGVGDAIPRSPPRTTYTGKGKSPAKGRVYRKGCQGKSVHQERNNN